MGQVCLDCNNCNCCGEINCGPENLDYYYGPDSYSALFKEACKCSGCAICANCLKNTANEVALGNIHQLSTYNCGAMIKEKAYRKALGDEMFAKFEVWRLNRAVAA